MRNNRKGLIMDEIINQLKCVINHLSFIMTECNSVDFDIEVLKTCILQLEERDNKLSDDEIINKLEKVSWKSYSDVARRNLLWLDDAIKIIKNNK